MDLLGQFGRLAVEPGDESAHFLHPKELSAVLEKRRAHPFGKKSLEIAAHQAPLDQRIPVGGRRPEPSLLPERYGGYGTVFGQGGRQVDEFSSWETPSHLSRAKTDAQLRCFVDAQMQLVGRDQIAVLENQRWQRDAVFGDDRIADLAGACDQRLKGGVVFIADGSAQHQRNVGGDSPQILQSVL